MRLVHVNWSEGALHIWAEVARSWSQASPGALPVDGGGAPAGDGERRDGETAPAPAHPFAASRAELRAMLAPVLEGITPGADVHQDDEEPTGLTLRLPVRDGVPVPSPRLAHALGHTAGNGSGAVELGRVAVETVRVGPAAAAAVLERLEGLGGDDALLGDREEDEAALGNGEVTGRIGGLGGGEIAPGPTVRFFAAAARLTRHLLAQQRFVPSLRQENSGQVRGLWQPWLADEQTVERVRKLLEAMPGAARAVEDDLGHHPWGVLQDFVVRLGDAMCRGVLVKEEMSDAVAGREPGTDPHVAWLTGLLGEEDEVPAGPAMRGELLKRVYRWISVLEDRGSSSQWRLMLRLLEPLDLGGLGDLQPPDEQIRWTLSFHLQSVQTPGVVIDASDIWLLPAGAATVEGHRIESPQDVLLGELGRAARLYKPLEAALEQAQPTELELSTSEAYRFLRQVRPILREQGVDVEAPKWWDMPTVRLGARLQVESEEIDFEAMPGAGPSRADPARLGLRSLVNYHWQLAIGDVSLTLEQFQKLAAQHSPLVRLNGKWVEVRPEDVKAAMEFLKRNPGGEMEVGQLLRLAYASDVKQTGLPILGMDATGWVGQVFGEAGASEKMPILKPPEGFVGALRPYQIKGMSWLAFLDRFGLGACLADDMGLGKTIQLLALLAYERDHAAPPGPTLLVVPMSVVGNWIHETRRFTPRLKVLVHHGLDRLQGAALTRAASEADLVITTYALAHRDRDELAAVEWWRVCLDEAQSIKNPSAKQTQAIRSIPAPRRIALTGTPVENRLGELWSIMDFLNRGYLGPAGEFRSRFAMPIERFHDQHRSAQLRGLIQPFVLRRLKTDRSVIADLPEKIETKEYCFLTPEQAQLYRTCVSDMLSAAEKSEGIQRRGVVLAGLIKLKQICNHPAQFFKEAAAEEGAGPPSLERSGKCLRLAEMLREVVDNGDRALVFTQFRQMGALLAAMLRHHLDREVLFLHGGTPAAQRQAMIKRFQEGEGSGAGDAPVFILSLKAGGLGLNLTAANHVFHFDRWWNPAVEAQATDRAYRIGQTRSVQVHKFIVSGTLEERIDAMIEQKTELAEKVIGAGERWLTELSTAQLRDLLILRPEAVADAGPGGGAAATVATGLLEDAT